MILLDNVKKSYPTRLGRKVILEPVTLEIPTDRNIAILGRNGAGKSTLLRLLGGIDFPDEGRITTDKRISMPLGLSTGHPELTGRQNTRFVARILGASEYTEIENFVMDFSELGKSYNLPMKTYSNGMKARLNFGISMAFDFEIYLLDEITAVGDPKFKKKAKLALAEKREKAKIIMVSHSVDQLREMCDFGIVINNGLLNVFDDLELAIDCYEKL